MRVFMGSQNYPNISICRDTKVIEDWNENVVLAFEGKIEYINFSPRIVHLENPLPFLSHSYTPFLSKLVLKNVTFFAPEINNLESLAETLAYVEFGNLRVKEAANAKVILRNSCLTALKKLKKLTNFTISRSFTLDGHFLLELVNSCKRLNFLSFDDCCNCTMNDMRQYVRNTIRDWKLYPEEQIVAHKRLLRAQKLCIPPEFGSEMFRTEIEIFGEPDFLLSVNLFFPGKTRYRTLDKAFFSEYYPEEWEKLRELDSEGTQASYLSNTFDKKLYYSWRIRK